MPLRVSGKNINIGAALRERISTGSKKRCRNISAAAIPGMPPSARMASDFARNAFCMDSGTLLEAEGMAADAYESADQAAVHIEKRLRRYKRRRKDHQAQRGG